MTVIGTRATVSPRRNRSFVSNIPSLLQQRLAHAGRIVLAFGVGRPFKRSDDDQPRHWLQLNNLHLETIAGWQLRWPRERFTAA